MLQETDLLQMLQMGNIQAHKQLFLTLVNDLTDYCSVLLDDVKRGREVVDNLFLRWYNAGYADATVPLSDWVHAQVDAECYKYDAPLFQDR